MNDDLSDEAFHEYKKNVWSYFTRESAMLDLLARMPPPVRGATRVGAQRGVRCWHHIDL